jgi:hypothetical protein
MSNDEIPQILLLLKLDAKRLYERILYRKPQYLFALSSKRTRAHFGDIFYSRYPACSIEHLKGCSQEVIIELDKFYTLVDDMKWFLHHTEDMPGTIEEHVDKFVTQIEKAFNTLELYLNAELAGKEPEVEQLEYDLAEEDEGPELPSFEVEEDGDSEELSYDL